MESSVSRVKSITNKRGEKIDDLPNRGTVWPWGCLSIRGLSNADARSSPGTFSQSLSPMKWTDLALMGSL